PPPIPTLLPTRRSSDLGQQSARHLLDQAVEFDAIFSAADYAAMGALQVLKEKNIPVPRQVGIVGFGNEPFTSFTDPPLSTVDQRSEEHTSELQSRENLV